MLERNPVYASQAWALMEKILIWLEEMKVSLNKHDVIIQLEDLITGCFPSLDVIEN